MKKKVAFCTLGCKVNQYETNAMIQKFIENEYLIVDFSEFADVYVINTCTVTNMADRKSRQMIRKVKEINPKSILVCCGCYAQTYKEKLKEIKEIDIIIGTNEKNRIVELVQKYIKEKKYLVEISDVMQEKDFQEAGIVTYSKKSRAVVKIQDGCDKFCSYCIIPYARGRVRSRKLENIITEIKEIAQRNIKEVVITGIHIASYGKDFDEKIGLIDLLEKINDIDGIERIRLGSLEPTLITEDFLERLKKMPKICEHFHLSLQSGCNETLKRMNRKYSIEQFKKIVELLRNTYKNVILTTDIIVGFPGESDDEYNQTFENLKQINFYKMHIFKYSARQGTPASKMINQISGDIKEKRSQKLLELSDINEQRYNKLYIQKQVKVLFEEYKDGYMRGHTKNYLVVKVKSKEIFENTIKNVLIKEVENLELIGEVKEAKN